MVIALVLQSIISPSVGEPPQLGSWNCRAPSIENDDAPRLRVRIALSWNLPTPRGEEQAIGIILRSSSSDYPAGRYQARFTGTDGVLGGRPWFEMYLRGHRIAMSNFDYARGTAEMTAGPFIVSGDVGGPMWAFRGQCELVI